MTKKQKLKYRDACRTYKLITGWDYLECLAYPKNVEDANNNINQAISFLFGVYADVQNSVHLL
jgi:hypothetical protein